MIAWRSAFIVTEEIVNIFEILLAIELLDLASVVSLWEWERNLSKRVV